MIDVSAANTLIGGYVLPDYAQLLDLCTLTGRQPGFFLDEQVPDFPEGTTIVRPVGPGEDLVVRLPGDVADRDAVSTGLIYHQAKTEHGYGIEAGDYVIAMAPTEPVRATPEKLYLFIDASGAAVRRCVDVNGTRAVFHEPGHVDVPLIVPVDSRLAAPGPHASQQFSQIVANLRAGRHLHMHA